MMNGSVFSRFSRVVLALCICSLFLYPLCAEEDCAEDIQLALARLTHFPNIDDWEVSSTSNEIRLTSKFQVSASSSQTILVEDFNEAEWFADNRKHFEIRIRFEPMMPYEEYLKLKAERQKWANMINEDYQNFEGEPLSEEQYEMAWKKLNELKLPSHIAAYSSVYIESPLDSADLSFDPDENLRKCVWMLYRVGFLFSEVVE